ncbi:endoplasmic reticulum resident protein 44-like [Daphnia pulicaria]|uniref:endoplasmic reticulum resident protein 44-like n=1 Tax=Daphnia pulicaria TaxID=35523 RepID=UPI001EEA07AC|nr:endoplasmic reticulum resident protein 44-like [Daphnia pulicaria]
MRIFRHVTPLNFVVQFLVLFRLFSHGECGAVQLTADNFDTIIANTELVLINFYADWCRFSNMLAPIFDEAADKVTSEFPSSRVILGKVDCDKDTSIGTRFHISKYPTLKAVRNGQLFKKEYRGQRSAEAFANFVREQLVDPMKEFTQLSEVQHNQMDDKKRHVIGYFETRDSPEYANFAKLAAVLKDDCNFHVGFGEVTRAMHPPGQPIVAFRPAKARSNDMDESFTGDLKSYDEFSIWTTDKCVPLVREITFENAEELTEEGLPFLILFYNPDDNNSIKKYNEIINRELLDEKQNINFLTADGVTFAHPLQHLGKSKKDLPLIAIDSFRHMYLFPKFEDINIPGKLKQFLADLHSGKLHREFHYGPDPATDPPLQLEHHAGNENSKDDDLSKKPTQPPESTFKKLAPSKNRYTLLDKDEL